MDSYFKGTSPCVKFSSQYHSLCFKKNLKYVYTIYLFCFKLRKLIWMRNTNVKTVLHNEIYTAQLWRKTVAQNGVKNKFAGAHVNACRDFYTGLTLN